MAKTGFFDYLGFALQFAPAGPEEKEIRAKLARLGIGAGKNFAFKELSPEQQAQVGLGMKEGGAKIEPWRGQGSQLAPRAERRHLSRDAPLLAEGHTTVDPAAW